MVRGMIIDNDDFQLLSRIILVDGAKDGPIDPRLFVKSRNDDGDPRRKIGIHLHRPVERAKKVA